MACVGSTFCWAPYNEVSMNQTSVRCSQYAENHMCPREFQVTASWVEIILSGEFRTACTRERVVEGKVYSLAPNPQQPQSATLPLEVLLTTGWITKSTGFGVSQSRWRLQCQHCWAVFHNSAAMPLLLHQRDGDNAHFSSLSLAQYMM